MAEDDDTDEDKLFAQQLSIFILVGYALLLLLAQYVEHGCMIQAICCMIFMVQQLQLVTRYDPISNKKGMGPYRAESAFQLYTFVCLVIGPSTPFKLYITPVITVYAFSYWTTHLNATDSDLLLYEIILQFLQSSLFAVFVGYVSQFLTVRAYLQKSKPETVAAVLQQQLGGVIILKEGVNEITYVNDYAKSLLMVPKECDELQERIDAC